MVAATSFGVSTSSWSWVGQGFTADALVALEPHVRHGGQRGEDGYLI